MAGGRRGATTFLNEVVLSIIFVAVFALAVVNYINANAKGEEYFARFYAADLGTSAELVNAGYGDVVLRYDNLKPNLELRFWLDNGKIGVSHLPEGTVGEAAAELIDQIPRFFLLVPQGAAAQFYGLASTYIHGPVVLDQPVFLVLRKTDAGFIIDEAETEIRQCPLPNVKEVAKEQAVIHLAMADKAKAERISSYLAKQGLKVTSDPGAANIMITLHEQAGSPAVSAKPTSIDGRSLACLIGRRLNAITLKEHAFTEPDLYGGEFTLEVTISGDRLPEQTIGQAVAEALAVYLR